jgi:hypothetical protein
MLRRTKSLFGITDSLFPTEQGIVGNASKLLCKAAPERDETAGNFRIPCYFPCSIIKVIAKARSSREYTTGRRRSGVVDGHAGNAITPWLCIYEVKASRKGERKCAFHGFC